jgi:hypothetical protein
LALLKTAEIFGARLYTDEAYESMLRAITWLLGDSMPPEILGRASRDPSVLATLSQNQAVRELWGGEPFWGEYRRRLREEYRGAFASWLDYLFDPSHRVELLLTPGR